MLYGRCVNFVFCPRLQDRFKIVIYDYVMPDMSYFAVLIAAFVSFTFLIFPATKNAPRDRVPWYDTILAVASLAGPIYVSIYNMDILLEGWVIFPPLGGKIIALITWAVIIEAVRRTGGGLLASIVLLVSLYPLFAHLCPGILMAKQYSLARILGFNLMGMQSIFGLPTQVFCRLLIGYMIFAVALQVTGAASFFINFCLAILGGFRGGAAKVSILSSAFFATMSGSAIANVVRFYRRFLCRSLHSRCPAHISLLDLPLLPDRLLCGQGGPQGSSKGRASVSMADHQRGMVLRGGNGTSRIHHLFSQDGGISPLLCYSRSSPAGELP